jgi:hypothetical protein
MTNLSNRPFSVIEKVAGARAILTVIKRVQEAKPEAKPSLVWRATRLAVMEKLSKLEKAVDAGKELSETQTKALHALRVADTQLINFEAMFGDDETTRELDDDERAILAKINEERKARAKASADARKAKAAAKATKTTATVETLKQLALA